MRSELNYYIVLLFAHFAISFANYDTYYISNYCANIKSGAYGQIHLGTEPFRSTIILKATQASYKNNITCAVTIVAPENHGLILTLTTLNLRPYPRQGNVYNGDRVYIDIDTNQSKVLLANDSIIDTFSTEGNNKSIDIKFQTASDGDSTDGKNFQFIFTVFAHNTSKLCQNDDRFDCNNGKCIYKIMKCDSVNNCGNNYDEQSCGDCNLKSKVKKEDSNRYLIVGIIGWAVAVALTVGLIVVLIIKRNNAIKNERTQSTSSETPIVSKNKDADRETGHNKSYGTEDNE